MILPHPSPWLQRWLVVAILFVVLAVPVYALLRSRISGINNTFSSGRLALRFFYDCRTPSGVSNVNEERFAQDDLAAIVDCQPEGDGSDEPTALQYDKSDGATIGRFVAQDTFNLEKDWSLHNGWWQNLSSAFDHTLIGPEWGASPETTNVLSVGNSGEYSLNVSLVLQSEDYNQLEVMANQLVESWDGRISHPNGGDNVDPRTDEEWTQFGEQGRQYNVDLAEKVGVKIKRVNAQGEPLNIEGYEGTLAALWDQPIELGSLAPSEVAHVAFEWVWLEGEDNNQYQGYFFDYSFHFDAVSIPST